MTDSPAEPTDAPRIPLVGEATATIDQVTSFFRLDGTVAVITGASSGIGQRIARVLHVAGAHVVLTARRGDRLKQLCADLGARSEHVVCDLHDRTQMDGLVAGILERHGKIDILVNNAGVVDDVPSEEEELDQFADVVNTNLIATFNLSKLVGGSMLARGTGSIINMSSIFGLVAAAPFAGAGYTATKGGVVHLTRELGVQWAPRGVRVNGIAPGWFPTEMTEGALCDEGAVGYINGNTPLGRAGLEHELDAAVLFLAGSGSSYVVGQTLAVDGGWTAR